MKRHPGNDPNRIRDILCSLVRLKELPILSPFTLIFQSNKVIISPTSFYKFKFRITSSISSYVMPIYRSVTDGAEWLKIDCNRKYRCQLCRYGNQNFFVSYASPIFSFIPIERAAKLIIWCARCLVIGFVPCLDLNK